MAAPEAPAPEAAPASSASPPVVADFQVLAAALQPPPEEVPQTTREVPDREIDEGIAVLRGLLLEGTPDAVLVLDDAGSRALPAAQVAALTGELDRVRQEAAQSDDAREQLVVSSATVASGFSVGYVVWLLRGGVLLSGLLSTMPAWRVVDPLPVLGSTADEGEDDDSGEDVEDAGLDEMLEEARARDEEER